MKRLGLAILMMAVVLAEASRVAAEVGEATGGELRWSQAALGSLFAYARRERSSAVIVVHHGKVIAERYWSVDAASGSPYANQLWGKTDAGAPIEDVASVQKSIVSVLVGIAVDQELLDLDAPVSTHLKAGWSNAPCDEESAITVRHLLSMTSGLSPALEYQARAGSAWRYNTQAYSRLLGVLEAVTGDEIGPLTKRWLTDPVGMHDTAWRRRHWVTPGMDANSLGLFTTARDLVRFGELMLAGGGWQGRRLVSRGFVEAAVKPSQSLNPAYGLLWWLNGPPPSPAPEAAGNAVLAPAAPRDMYAAQGALGRKMYVAPSLDLVVVRLGDAPEDDFNSRFWELLMAAAPAARSAREVPRPDGSTSRRSLIHLLRTPRPPAEPRIPSQGGPPVSQGNQPVVAMLSPAEMELVRLLREPGASAVRARVKTVVEGLLMAAKEPFCPEKPCPQAPGECERCSQTMRVLEGLEAMEMQIKGLPGA